MFPVQPPPHSMSIEGDGSPSREGAGWLVVFDHTSTSLPSGYIPTFSPSDH